MSFINSLSNALFGNNTVYNPVQEEAADEQPEELEADQPEDPAAAAAIWEAIVNGQQPPRLVEEEPAAEAAQNDPALQLEAPEDALFAQHAPQNQEVAIPVDLGHPLQTWDAFEQQNPEAAHLCWQIMISELSINGLIIGFILTGLGASERAGHIQEEFHGESTADLIFGITITFISIAGLIAMYTSRPRQN